VGASPAKPLHVDGPTSPDQLPEGGAAEARSLAQEQGGGGAEGAPLQYAGSQSFTQNTRHADVAAAQHAAEKEEERLYLDEEQFSSLQEEVEDKQRKLDKLRKKLKAANREMEDLQTEFQDERDDFQENIRLLKKENALWLAVCERHVSRELIEMYEEQSHYDEIEESWTLPPGLGLEKARGGGMQSGGGGSSGSGGSGSRGGKPPRGGKQRQGSSRSGKENKSRSASEQNMPPSDIGGMSPTAGDAQFNEILGGGLSDDDEDAADVLQHARQQQQQQQQQQRGGGSQGSASSSGGGGGGRLRSGGGKQPSEYRDQQAGRYFTEDADRERRDAGRRVLGDASALKNEMVDLFNGNIVLWGAGNGGPLGGGGGDGGAAQAAAARKAKAARDAADDLGPRRAPHRLGGHELQELNATQAAAAAGGRKAAALLPLPGGRGGFLDEIADQAAVDKVAADAARFNQQQVLTLGGGGKKKLSDAEEMLFVKELTAAAPPAGKMTL
jgi:hypothetical protein